MSKKYLYGASVQGIQNFIFSTNKLAEIVGASEIVEKICTKLFYDLLAINKDDENIIISAAGNIKYIFDDEERCKALVRDFPKKVMEEAPGITISQAVQIIDNNNELLDAIDALELKLKVQRNKLVIPTERGFMGLERSRRTGGVAFDKRKTRKGTYEIICETTNKKRSAINSDKFSDVQNQETLFKKISGLDVNNSQICLDIEDMTKGNINSWIAVIHADGNGLGKILQNLGQNLVHSNNEKSKKAFRMFSIALENATKKAAQTAFETIIKNQLTRDGRFPIRPVVCGGDDLTVIVRADLALPYTHEFLKAFERETAKEFMVLEEFGIKNYFDGITACAGIAYIKESYPLHYALHLAESLCSDAKKKVKTNELLRPNGIPESSLAFYKVQESFIEDLYILKGRTMKTPTGMDFYNGPYTFSELENLNKDIETIRKMAEKDEKSKAVGKLRQIVSETYIDPSTAVFMLNRMKEINHDFYNQLKLDSELKAIEENTKSKLFDLITIHSFNNGNRNN